MIFKEGELEFDFTGCQKAYRLEDLKKKPTGMKMVDFIIEEKNKVFLIEIKDRASRTASAKAHENLLKDLKSDNLVIDLVPKARDTYTYLHLMEEDEIPITYVVVLGVNGIGVKKEKLKFFKSKLVANLKKEADEPWKRSYIEDCIVVTTADWSDKFTYPLRRLNI